VAHDDTPAGHGGKRGPEPASKAQSPGDAVPPPLVPLKAVPPREALSPAFEAPVLHMGPPPPAARTGGRDLPIDRARQDAWVERLRAGDGQALREVVDAFSERITAVVGGMIRDRDAVEDVVHETFVKAFFRIGSFQGGSSLYTWLYRVAINAAKDHAKRRRRRPALALDDVGPAGTSLPAPDAPEIERLERRETRLRVRAAIQSLPAKFRAVLVLREIEGLRYEEIAEILDVSQGTVESRLFRARRRMQIRLADLERNG
jgi:RNA polymerase sigma-70 factor (ECF subfamily)